LELKGVVSLIIFAISSSRFPFCNLLQNGNPQNWK
jgi:hypothetical protein